MAKKKVAKAEKVDESRLGRNGGAMLEELLEAGAHFGHRADRWNPKIAPYVFGVREGIHIFDLEKTRDSLIAACRELARRSSLGQTILLVGTKPQAKTVITELGQKLDMPYISERWVGGLLTNFGQIKKSIDKLSKMKEERETGVYKKFTKKEQLLLDRKITKLEKIFGGVAGLRALPDFIFIVDVVREATAVAEARRCAVPITAVVDTNADPTLIDFPIPANDDSGKSIEYIVGKVGEAIQEGLKRKVAKVEEVEPARSASSTADAGGQVAQAAA